MNSASWGGALKVSLSEPFPQITICFLSTSDAPAQTDVSVLWKRQMVAYLDGNDSFSELNLAPKALYLHWIKTDTIISC